MQGIHKYDNNDPAFLAIADEIKADPLNAIGYLKLGAYYGDKNLYKSYLCYENALFYCKDESLRSESEDIFNELAAMGYSVPRAAIVILSYNLRDYTLNCIQSIKDTTPDSAREIIVVDNASVDDSVEYLRRVDGIMLIENKENAGFPGGCNIGIRAAAPTSDIYLLNNDTLLMPNSLFWLRMGLYEDESIGSVGGTANNAINGQIRLPQETNLNKLQEFAMQANIPMISPYENKVFLMGYSLLCRRTVLEKIGYLDERFNPGNYEDDDLGLRMLEAGYKNLICENSFIVHFGSKSFRSKEKDRAYLTLLAKNKEKLNQKLGISDCWEILQMDFVALKFYAANTKHHHNNIFLTINCGLPLALYLTKYNFGHRYITYEEDCFVDKYIDALDEPIYTPTRTGITYLLEHLSFNCIFGKNISEETLSILAKYNYRVIETSQKDDNSIYYLLTK